MVLFGKKWLYSGKSGCIRAKLLYSDNKVSFGQKWCYSGNMVVFGSNWLYTGKSGSTQVKVVVFWQ